MSATTPLLGGVLDAATAAVIGLPRVSRSGLDWHFGRAGLPYSLASELSRTADDRTTLACYTERLIDSLERINRYDISVHPNPTASAQSEIEISAN